MKHAKHSKQIVILLTLTILSILNIGHVWGQEDCYSETFAPFGRPHDFNSDIQPIFDQNCADCHSPGGEGYEQTGLDLRAGNSYESLIWVPSSQDPSRLLVDPTSVEESLLWHKINCDEPGVGERMPMGEPRLDFQTDQLTIRTWLIEGAPGPDGETPPRPEHKAINFGMSGSWYDPDTAGQGFAFDVIVERTPPLFVVYWFTYSENAGGPDEQRWYLAQGEFQDGDHVVNLELFQVVGGRFDASSPAAEAHSVGTAMIEFETCDRATLTYEFEGGEMSGGSDEIDLERLSPDVLCASLSDDDQAQ